MSLSARNAMVFAGLLWLMPGCEPSEPDHGDCPAYLDCVEAAAPEELQEKVLRYGEEGDCWYLADEYTQACRYTCASELADLEDAYGPGCTETE